MPQPLDASPDHPLASVPLFASLPPAAIDWLLERGRVRRYPARQVLCSEGDPGDALIILEEGQLRVSRFTPDGQEIVLATEEAPSALGELSLLDGAPRAATIIAQRPVTVRLVPRSAFLELLRQEPDLLDGLLRMLAKWLRQTTSRYVDVLSLDAPGRLAKWLLERAEREENQLVVIPGRGQGDLAVELGTTRFTVNKALKEFEALGLLVVQRDRIVLLKPDGLRDFLS